MNCWKFSLGYREEDNVSKSTNVAFLVRNLLGSRHNLLEKWDSVFCRMNSPSKWQWARNMLKFNFEYWKINVSSGWCYVFSMYLTFVLVNLKWTYKLKLKTKTTRTHKQTQTHFSNDIMVKKHIKVHAVWLKWKEHSQNENANEENLRFFFSNLKENWERNEKLI